MSSPKKMSVLLVCGAGASSGFMAANIRKAAAARGIEMDIKARSEAEIESYIDDIDALMVGPHLSYILDEVDSYIDDRPVHVMLIPADFYAKLDGEGALDFLLSEMAGN